VTALQSIVARNVDPMDTAVVSTTQIHAGDTWNVIPQECTLRGTVRTFKKPVQDMIEKQIEKIARNVAAGFGAEVVKWRYERRYPATVNSVQETEFAAHAASALVGLDNVNRNPTPAMGSEDFAWMLLKRPAATSGSATATARAVAWSTTRATTSTTRSCRSARRTGRPWSSSSSPVVPFSRRRNRRRFSAACGRRFRWCIPTGMNGSVSRPSTARNSPWRRRFAACWRRDRGRAGLDTDALGTFSGEMPGPRRWSRPARSRPSSPSAPSMSTARSRAKAATARSTRAAPSRGVEVMAFIDRRRGVR
jgi:hypothetical protein